MCRNGPRMLRVPWARAASAAAVLAVAACAAPSKSYYPLEARRTWTYAMSIQPAAGEAIAADSRVTNLEERRVAEQIVTPQATEAFGQRRLRFISSGDRRIAEIAEQLDGAPEPRIKSPANTILEMPLTVDAAWETTWETNQFGQRTLLPITKTVESIDQPCTVASRTFGECLHLRLTGSGQVKAGERSATVDLAGEEWFVPGVGYVKGLFAEHVRGLPQNDVRVEVTLTGSTP